MTPIFTAELQPRPAAILFTDIVDSTGWHRAVGDGVAGRVWAAHDESARRLLNVWRGQEVGRTDGFLILFASCDDAVGFALAYHAVLGALEHPLLARVGIHWGPVLLRANKPEDVANGAVPFDVDGLALPAAARVMSVAQGGQTLLSADAAGALGSPRTAAREITSHGHWRLKGIDEPIELIELSLPGTIPIPPPDGAKAYRVVERDGLWVPVRELPNNLGRDLDRFVGRRVALRELAKAFEDGARLVNLIGIGGIGKTRLARRYAQAWLGDHPGGCWFCDLSSARGVDGIALAVAQALQVPLGGADPVQQLAAVLQGLGECLLVLDNFEQVARCASSTLGEWMARALDLRVLVTSREVLGLPGEQVQVLAPLDTDEGVDLYLQRLRDGGHTAPLDSADQAVLPKLVAMLDQLPLAIELSAARVRSVGPSEQLRRIGERFRLLAVRGGRHDRQATIRSTLDWSWDLLRESEQTLLAQLSVFDGGFTLEAAEAVCELSQSSADEWIADLLQSLVEKSLLRRASLQRFEMLRTVQDYGLERLGANGQATRLRHARHFAGRSDTSLQSERGIELDNLVSACRWAGAESLHESQRGLELERLAVALLVHAWAVLRLTGPFRAAIELARPLHERADLQPASVARVCRVVGAAHGLLGRAVEARASFEAGIRWADAAGDRALAAHLQCLLADQDIRSGRLAEAEVLLRQARALDARDEGVELVLASTEGQAALARSEPMQARQCFERALALARQQGDRRWEGGIQGNLGRLAIVNGQPDAARLHLSEALRCAAELGDRQWEGNVHCNLGFLLFEQGELAAAGTHLNHALELSRMLGHRWLEATVLCNLGLVHGARGAHGEAVPCLEAAVRIAHELGAPATEGQFGGYLAVAMAATGDLDGALSTFEWAQTLLSASEHAHDHALLLSLRSRVLAEAGRTEQAARDIRAVEAMAAGLRVGPDSELHRSMAAARAALS